MVTLWLPLLMGYQAALAVLADDTRRAIVDRLRTGPAPVVEIARGLPVSRPAVSKHLRVMREAGLVRMREEGTRNLYELDLGGLAELRSYVESFWDKALERFRAEAEKEEDMETTVAPVTKSIELRCTPEHAFEVFTDRLADWWPMDTYSVFGAGSVPTFEGRDGGRIYEMSADGATADWGIVLEWDPPRRVIFTWSPGRDTVVSTEIEIRFEATGGGTRVELVHRGWERFGADANARRDAYDGGWEAVLARFAAGVEA